MENIRFLLFFAPLWSSYQAQGYGLGYQGAPSYVYTGGYGHGAYGHEPGYGHDDYGHEPGYGHGDYGHEPVYGHDDYGHEPGYGHDDYGHEPGYGHDDYGHESEHDAYEHESGYDSEHAHGEKSEKKEGYAHEEKSVGYKGGHVSESNEHEDHGHTDYEGDTKVEFCILDSHGKYISGASVFYTNSNSIGFVKTGKSGTVSVAIKGPVTFVIVFAPHLDTKTKKIQLYGEYIKENFALNKPTNFRLLLQDAQTCLPLDDVWVKYKSGNVLNTVHTGKGNVAHVRVETKKNQLKAMTKKDHYTTGLFESEVDLRLAKFAPLSIPPKFKYGEFFRVILDFIPRSCVDVTLNTDVVSGSVPVRSTVDCISGVAPASTMMTFTSQTKSQIVIFVVFETSAGSNCISGTQARVTLYNPQGKAKTLSSVGLDPISYNRVGLWLVGCISELDLKTFIAINKFLPSNTALDQSLC